MRPLYKDLGCDNVLPDSGYRMRQERMTDECGLMAEGRIEGTQNRKLPECHFIRASLTCTHSELNPGLWRETPARSRLSYIPASKYNKRT
jgi:hypothetical protein